MVGGARGCKVLVVDDESLVVMLIEDMLGELGHEMTASAAHLDRALELARNHEFDLAILEINLAGKSIHPVARALKDRNIAFVFASGYDSSDILSEFEDTPIVGKPFEIERLAEAISRALSMNGRAI
ncbi:Response regulator receiver domain-containing protein [Rhizobiales bacterium GAS191]|jgi:two-component SAPR family response regulator|nr:Response regulator receiver domain-containing protein [Rhizobiales bacterium GAS113]SED51787.1 Response regulator receiver domain-containing protein [Rhizobiales bacterium GAS191]